MYSSLCAGSRSWQSASLPGSELPSSAPFRRTRGIGCFAHDAPRDGRILLEKRSELLVQNRLDNAFDFRVAELRLRLTFELRARNLDADDGGQTFPDVVSCDAFLQVLGQRVLRRIGVDRARQRRTESGEMRAAFVRVDVVRERIDDLRIAVIPLQRDLGVDAVFLAAHVNGFLVDGILRLVQMFDERDNTALVVELVVLSIALVVERDGNAAVQERQLAEPLRQRVEAEDYGFENSRVGLERDLGATAF